MSSNHRSRPVQPRLATAILIALASLALTVAAAAVRPAEGFARGGCRGAGGIPATHSLGELRSATLCLINKIRSHHGLGRLHPKGCLAKAAQGHSNDMVHRDYFSHDSPGGGSIQTRIGGTGYFAGAHRWSYGEIIGGGTADSGSPSSVTTAWMH